MAKFMGSKFPPGLLNPGHSAAADGVAHWCVRFLGIECPTRQEFIFNLFFSSRGVWMLLPFSVVLLLLYRLVGPPEVCWCSLCVGVCVSSVGVFVCSFDDNRRGDTF